MGGERSSLINIAQDHLFTILLHLPIDSILSFSMTCKRFWSLISCSDNFWESVCRRDWGPTCVDALKSHEHLPWMRLYKQVSLLDSVSCLKIGDPLGESVSPSPRASHSLNFVSGCLLLFGGGCEGGRHLDDTWAAYVGDDFRRTSLKWQKINSGIPSGRFGHTCVVIGDYLVLFGGINDNGIRQNDTWMGKLTFHEILGITLSWKLLDVEMTPPPPRGAHAACSVEDRKMVIHGGIGLSSLRLSDSWVLELSENLCFGTWREVSSDPCPPARSGHTITSTGGTRAVLFGGRGSGYEALNDIWVLDVSQNSMKWVQTMYDIQNKPEGFALRRVGHSATLILGGRLLIYGGEDSYRRRKDDFWVLDISTILPSNKVYPIALDSKLLMGSTWKRLKAKGYKPESRSFHRACIDPSGCRLFVFGGMVDGLLQPADSSGLKFNGELFVVELMVML